MSENKGTSLNFIEQIIEEDLSSGKHAGRIHTRFPPEPNGYLHIGHVKAICINFETAKKYGGKTNLRFDDTNPTSEKTEYVDAIQNDIKWLGFDWNEDKALYASNYFAQLYEFAIKLIKDGNAYVDDSTVEEIAEMKGTPTEAGKNSPYRERSVEENLDLFTRMKNGEFEDGARVLRAKVNMESPNMHMRDPVIYRIKKATHHRTGDDWCIYPMYDFAHGQSDSIENITHSLCSLEFRHHRPLYDWFIEKLEIFPSRQIEFARMNVEYMVTSKRKLLKLVNDGVVTGWDDPRMATVSGLRRKGYPAEALRTFCDKAGVAKRENLIEFSLLESCVRDVLNRTAHRAMVVMDPVKLTITNYPKDQVEIMIADNGYDNPEAGQREVPFSGHLLIEKSDFMEDAPRKFFRLSPGRDVRLKNGYIVHCEGCVKDEEGNVTEVLASYYPNSKSGQDESGIKAKGTLHWVSEAHAISAELRNYNQLFTDPTPTSHEDKDYTEFINPNSLEVIKTAKLEPSLKDAIIGQQYQFMRTAYYTTDIESSSEHLIFNRTVTLKDSWGKKQNK